jgi:antirestriction protein ArdC
VGSLYDDITNSIIATLERGEYAYQLPWHQSAATGNPRNALTGRAYHGINTLLLWAAAQNYGYSTSLWATYRQ